MLRDGDKGAVLQRDGRTYAVTPHLPGGVISVEMLRKIADVAEKYGARLKCTSAQRIAIVGLKEDDVDQAWAALGGQRPGHMIGNVVRSVKACPGTQMCKRARQDSLEIGRILDEKYYGRKLPGKMKIGVSGCPNDCSESCIRDVGMIGGARGWLITVGGCGGRCPRLAKSLNYREVPTDKALEIVDKVVTFFEQNAREDERLADVIQRLGMGVLREAAGVAE